MGKGVRPDPLQDIQLIRDNLNDRYQLGFPIIKEILQNTEDANASSVDFAVCPGIPGAENPLLRNPAFVAINDGPFSANDAEAIGHFGLSYKGADQHTIGKFGLGLKSLFHLCDAFFYLASPDPTEDRAATDYPRQDVFNPWYTDKPDRRRYPSEWDHLSANDQSLMRGMLGELLSVARWFCLWVPLRKDSPDLAGVHIMRYFPGDQEHPEAALFGDQTAVHVGSLLPLLRRVRECRGWLIGQSQRRQLFQVSLLPAGGRILFDGELHESLHVPSAFSGHVLIQDSIAGNTQLDYWGCERILDDPTFENLRHSRHFPQACSKDAQTHSSQQAPEKAFPHCAVTLAVLPTRGATGRLETRWAVFLPMKESSVAAGLPRHEAFLTLHGYFFLDAGRSQVDIEPPKDGKQDESEVDVRKNWNATLARGGTLRLILPVLSEFARTNADAVATMDVTRAISQSPVFEQCRPWICGQWSWLYRLTATSGGDSWCLCPARTAFYEVPPPPSGMDSLPHLLVGPLADRLLITRRDHPRLTAAEASSWWAGDVAEVLRHLPQEEFLGRPEGLSYLADFLELASDRSEAVALAACTLVRSVVSRHGFQQLRNEPFRAAFVRVLAQTDPGRLCFIDPGPAPRQCEVLLSGLTARVQTDTIVLPADFRPSDYLDRRLANEGGIALLRDLHGVHQGSARGPVNDATVTHLALAILQACSNSEAVIEATLTLPLFAAEDLSGQGASLFCLKVLRDAHQERRLFSGGDAAARALQKAIPGISFIIYGGRLQPLFSDSVEECTPEVCCDLLGAKRPVVGPPAYRVGLVEVLVKASRLAERRSAIRYALHGTLGRWEDERLLLASSATARDLIGRLTRQLAALAEDAWAFIPPELSDILNANHRETLGVASVTLKTLESHLQLPGVAEKVDCGDFSPADNRELLTHLGDDVLRRLRMHRTKQGQLSAIGPACYWDIGYELDDVLSRQVTLLQRDPDPVVWSCQQKLAAALDAKSVIRLAALQPKPHRHFAIIASALATYTESLDSETADLLRRQSWIPCGNDRVVMPDNVVYLKGMDNIVHSVFRRIPSGQVVSALELPSQVHPETGTRAFNLLVGAQVIPARSRALRTLAEILSMCPDDEYLFGLQVPESEDDLQKIVDVLCDVGAVMPVMPVIAAVLEQFGPEMCLGTFLPDVAQRPIRQSDRVAAILDFIADKSRTSLSQAGVLLELHDTFLRQAITASVLPGVLLKCRLLNRRGQWIPAAELCADAPSVHPKHLLASRHMEILAGHVAVGEITATGDVGNDEDGSAPDSTLERQLHQSAEAIRQYFRRWGSHASKTEIGGFLSVLGDWRPIHDLAADYLSPHTVRMVREQMEWRPLPRPKN